MWQLVINYFRKLQVYRDLSPDRGIRRQVNAQLRHRPRLSLEAWSTLFPKVKDTPISQSLFAFIYRQLYEYSGLDVGRIRADDRLIKDLQLPLVCWFDWRNRLCDDFLNTFQVDISDDFDESRLETVGDLLWFLHQRLQSPDSVTQRYSDRPGER